MPCRSEQRSDSCETKHQGILAAGSESVARQHRKRPLEAPTVCTCVLGDNKRLNRSPNASSLLLKASAIARCEIDPFLVRRDGAMCNCGHVSSSRPANGSDQGRPWSWTFPRIDRNWDTVRLHRYSCGFLYVRRFRGVHLTIAWRLELREHLP